LDTYTDFEGRVVKHLYDSRDRVAETRYYQSVANFTAGIVAETVQYGYDIYDAAGRHDRVTETKGTQVRVTDTLYDLRGRLIRVSSPEGVVNYSYNDAT
jgi:hypothetical protein